MFYRPGGAGGGSREMVAYTKTAESPAQSQTPTRVCIKHFLHLSVDKKEKHTSIVYVGQF